MSMDMGDMSADISMQSIESTDVFGAFPRPLNGGRVLKVAQESETFIPSESSIKVAKERRERIRKTGVSHEDDFISLSVVKRPEESQGPHPESRLMREEDELGEGDDGALSCPNGSVVTLNVLSQNMPSILVRKSESPSGRNRVNWRQASGEMI
jgi:hypothetical protein